MRDAPDVFEQHFQDQLQRESERLVFGFNVQSVARKAMRADFRRPQRLIIITGTVAAATVITLAGIGLLRSGESPAGTGTLTSSPTSPAVGTIAPTVQAQSLLNSLLASRPGHAAAAAFVTTSYATYAASLPDTAGIQGTPANTDVVIVVEVEGFFPASHSCGLSAPACFDTGIMVTYDSATAETIDIAYLNDPWSRDRPSPEASVSERFRELRQWGTPLPLQVAN